MTREQSKKTLIYLAGFMGSGKSTIGPILANTLGYEFVDIDKWIEQKTSKRIVELFQTEGEQRFRALEREALQASAARDHCVVSLGGGSIANEENFQLIRLNGIVVYLQLAPEEILHRVQHRTDRPLLRDEEGNILPPEQLDARVRDLLERRSQFYERADIVVASDRKRVGSTVDEIVKRLRSFQKKEGA